MHQRRQQCSGAVEGTTLRGRSGQQIQAYLGASTTHKRAQVPLHDRLPPSHSWLKQNKPSSSGSLQRRLQRARGLLDLYSRENKGPLGHVELSRQKVAKQGGPSFEYEPLPRMQTTSQKENDQVTCKSKRTEEREKKKEKRGPPETGRAAKEPRRPVTCQFDYEGTGTYSEAMPVLSEPSLAMLPGRLFQVFWVSFEAHILIPSNIQSGTFLPLHNLAHLGHRHRFKLPGQGQVHATLSNLVIAWVGK